MGNLLVALGNLFLPLGNDNYVNMDKVKLITARRLTRWRRALSLPRKNNSKTQPGGTERRAAAVWGIYSACEGSMESALRMPARTRESGSDSM